MSQMEPNNEEMEKRVDELCGSGGAEMAEASMEEKGTGNGDNMDSVGTMEEHVERPMNGNETSVPIDPTIMDGKEEREKESHSIQQSNYVPIGIIGGDAASSVLVDEDSDLNVENVTEIEGEEKEVQMMVEGDGSMEESVEMVNEMMPEDTIEVLEKSQFGGKRKRIGKKGAIALSNSIIPYTASQHGKLSIIVDRSVVVGMYHHCLADRKMRVMGCMGGKWYNDKHWICHITHFVPIQRLGMR